MLKLLEIHAKLLVEESYNFKAQCAGLTLNYFTLNIQMWFSSK